MTEQRTQIRETVEQQWERTLAEGGLPAKLDPIEEGSSDDVSGDEGETNVIACEEITLTQIERRIVERIKDLGWAATLDEANATTEQITRLADSGTAFLRATDSGQTVLAMANATKGDVKRAAARIEKPHIEKFVPRMNRPATTAVMFLDHHPSEVAAEERTSKHGKFVSEEFRYSYRVALSRRIIEANGGKLTPVAKRQMAEQLFGGAIRRARESGHELGEGFRSRVKRSLARAASEALSQVRQVGPSAAVGGTGPVVVEDAGKITARWQARVAARSETAWVEEMRERVECQSVSGEARRNARRAQARFRRVYAIRMRRLASSEGGEDMGEGETPSSLDEEILGYVSRNGLVEVERLEQAFSSHPACEVERAVARLRAAGKLRRLRRKSSGEVFVAAATNATSTTEEPARKLA